MVVFPALEKLISSLFPHSSRVNPLPPVQSGDAASISEEDYSTTFKLKHKISIEAALDIIFPYLQKYGAHSTQLGGGEECWKDDENNRLIVVYGLLAERTTKAGSTSATHFFLINPFAGYFTGPESETLSDTYKIIPFRTRGILSKADCKEMYQLLEEKANKADHAY